MVQINSNIKIVDKIHNEVLDNFLPEVVIETHGAGCRVVIEGVNPKSSLVQCYEKGIFCVSCFKNHNERKSFFRNIKYKGIYNTKEFPIENEHGKFYPKPCEEIDWKKHLPIYCKNKITLIYVDPCGLDNSIPHIEKNLFSLYENDRKALFLIYLPLKMNRSPYAKKFKVFFNEWLNIECPDNIQERYDIIIKHFREFGNVIELARMHTQMKASLLLISPSGLIPKWVNSIIDESINIPFEKKIIKSSSAYIEYYNYDTCPFCGKPKTHKTKTCGDFECRGHMVSRSRGFS